MICQAICISGFHNIRNCLLAKLINTEGTGQTSLNIYCGAHWFQDHLEVFNCLDGQSTMYSEPLEEVGEVPGAVHVPHQVVEEADGVHNLGWFNLKKVKLLG